MKKVIILTLLLLLGQPSWAQIRDFQTTRLNSSAGAGVASILSTEAAILNPASAAFFDNSSFSFQSYSTMLRNKSDTRATANDDFAKQNRSLGYFVSDHSGPVKGGVAYLQQNENNFKRETFTIHGTSPLGDKAAVGLKYSYLQDEFPSTFSPTREKHHQITLGGTYIIDEDTILGLVMVDPTRTNPGDERLLAGFQYDIADRFLVIGDIGTQYTKDVKEKHIWRGAIQINVFSDLFLRVGKFYDNVTEFKGTGWGASWIGPKLGIEFAQKISDKIGKDSYIYKNETLVDTSIAAILKF